MNLMQETKCPDSFGFSFFILSIPKKRGHCQVIENIAPCHKKRKITF